VPFVHHFYMCLHECVHNNLAGCPHSGRTPLWASLVQDSVGHVSSLVVGVGYKAHLDQHMQHHKFTNHEAKDPDVATTSGLLQERVIFHCVVSIMAVILAVLPSARTVEEICRNDKGWNLNADGTLSKVGAIQQASLCSAIFIRRLQVVVALITGYWKAVFFLWWLPQQIGGLSILVVFAWLPHHPHCDIGRYKDTRITLIGDFEPLRSILSYLVFCGHDYHLLHHLYPRVPWMRLKRLYHELEPVLQQRGVRIEGGRGRPPVMLGGPRGNVKPVCGPFSDGHRARKSGLERQLSEEELVKGSLRWMQRD